MLPNFEIRDFRAFSQLRIERFSQVNLIVGRNNVGKTMLLEAIKLYALGGDPYALRNLLVERDEVLLDVGTGHEEEDAHLRVEALFHRQPLSGVAANVLSLGPIDRPDLTVRIGLKFLRRVRKEPGSVEYLPVEEQNPNDPHIVPGIFVSQGRRQATLPLYYVAGIRGRPRLRSHTGLGSPSFVPARGVTDRELARWWDAVALKEGEDRVKECLRIIAPVDRITFVEHPITRGERIPMVRLEGDVEPQPLKSLGDGMARIFQIALALECAGLSPLRPEMPLFGDEPFRVGENGTFLLLDEIENGIHYTAQADLWRFIIKTAKRRGIQVFATSHSWDSIIGLDAATRDSSDPGATVIRLEHKQEREKGQAYTKAVLFEPRELEIIARDDIEVR